MRSALADTPDASLIDSAAHLARLGLLGVTKEGDKIQLSGPGQMLAVLSAAVVSQGGMKTAVEFLVAQEKNLNKTKQD